MTATGTVAQTYIVELDAKTIELEAKLAAANTKLTGFERRIESLQQTNAKAAASNEALGVSFATAGDKIKFTALGIGAALVAIEVKATEMATAVDGSLKQIGAASPALREDLRGVQETIDAVAEASGRDKDEIRAASEEIARLGVQSKAEFDAKLKAATLIADATGTQLSTAVEGVDQLGDAFNLTADQIVQASAKIYSASKGRVDFDSIFGALKQSIPRIKELGLDLDTAVSAIVAKLDQGFSAKKLGAFFTEHDAETIRAVAREAKISAGALQELEDAAAFRRGGADRDITRAINEYKTALESLGQETLPFVTKELSGLAGILATIDGTLDKLRAQSSVAILQQYGAIDASKLSVGSRGPFQERAGSAAGALRDAFALGQVDLKGLNADELVRLKAGVDKYVESLRAATGPQTAYNKQLLDSEFGYKTLLDNLDQLIAKAPAAAPVTGVAGAAGGAGKRPPRELTIAQKAQVLSFDQSFQSELASLTPGQGDNLEARIQKIRDEAKKMADFVDARTLDVEGKITRLRGAATAQAELQLKALGQDVSSAVAQLSESQAQQFQAASDKFIAQKRQELAALHGITDEERTAFAERIVQYEVQAANATVGLRALDQLSKANREAAKALDVYNNQAALLQAHEQELTAIIENGRTPRAERVKAEKELADLRQQQIDLSKQESAAVAAEIQREQDAIAHLAEIRDQIRALHPDDKTAEQLQATIDEMTKRIAELELKLAQLAGTAAQGAKNQYDVTRKTNSELEKQARIVRETINAAVQLGVAFGGIDQQTASILENVAALGENLGLLAGGDVAALPGVISSVASLVGSFFGADPEEEARQRALEENTQALIRAAQSLSALNDRLDAERAIFGDQGPVDDLKKLAAGLDKQLGQSRFGGFDTSTAEGRAALRKAIQDFFTAAGGAGGFGDGFSYGGVGGVGGIAGPDLLKALEQLIDYLNQADQQAGSSGSTTSPGTGGYNVRQEITEASAGRLAGLMTTQTIYAKRTSEATEALARYLIGANTLMPLQGPTVGPLDGSGQSGGVVVQQLIVQLSVSGGAPIDGPTAATIGTQIGQGITQHLESLDAGMAQRTRRRALRQTVYVT